MNNNGTHIHQFIAYDVPSTCKEQGYTLYKCNCGAEHRNNIKPIGQHNFVFAEEKQPTCNEAGERIFVCSVCGETQKTNLAPLGHSFGKWSIQEFPTCVKEGKEICVCSRCGETETKRVSAMGHRFTSKRKCADDKKMVEHICGECGETVVKPNKARKVRKWSVIAASLAIFAFAAYWVIMAYCIPWYHYTTAKKMLQEGNYTEAYYHFLDCRYYKDTDELLRNFDVEYEEMIVYYNGEYVKKHCNEYDDEGKIVRESIYDVNDKLTEYTEYGYTADGKLTFKTRYNEDGKTPLYLCEYNDNGDVVLKIDYDYNGRMTDKKENVYDDNGKLIESADYESDGSLKEKCEYSYDNNGNMILQIVSDEYGVVSYKNEWIYDDNGNNTWEIKYDAAGVAIPQYEFIYDNNGNAVCKIYYTDGVISQKQEYVYNNAGKVITAVYYDGQDNLDKKYEYELDGDNNVIKRTVYNSYDTVIIVNEYKRNKQGKTTLSVTYDKNNKEIERIEYKYNAQGNCIYSMNKNQEGKVIHKYDDYNRLMESTEYYNDGAIKSKTKYLKESNSMHLYLQTLMYIWDNAYYLVEYDEAGNENVRLESELDDNGNVIKTIGYNEDGHKICEMEFEYNEHGNETFFCYYNGEGKVKHKEETEYDENGIMTESVDTDYAGDKTKIIWKKPKIFYNPPEK